LLEYAHTVCLLANTLDFLGLLTYAALSTHTIVAGEGPTELRFVVPKHWLCISPVIKGWIEDPKTVPKSMSEKKDTALYFRACEPEVMDLVIRYLKEEDGNGDYELPPTDRNAIFYAKVYKLAICLG
jgi:hypothetical protein